MTRVLALVPVMFLSAVLIVDVAICYAALGPCNITVPANFANTIACTGAAFPPPPTPGWTAPGCIGAQTVTVQQKACGNTDSTSCTPMANNLFVISPALYVPTNVFGPCYGWATAPPPSPPVLILYSHDCVIGAPVPVPGGSNC